MRPAPLYDPFVRGRFPVGVRTIPVRDRARSRQYPCEIWYPAAGQHEGREAARDAAPLPGSNCLIVYSHPSGGGRRAATFLCTHLCSHGYVVAALDHSELIAPELARKENETDEEKEARTNAWMASRVPDLTLLVDHLLAGPVLAEIHLDPARVGAVGHSFGGWTVLAATDVERRIRSVVALAPGGSSRPKPGMLKARLAFEWGRDVPTLYLVAENDASLPLSGMVELFDRTPATKRMVVLRRADHMHFMDDVERMHETVRRMPFTGELAWLPGEMRPIAELCSGEQAHAFTRGLALGHLDATLRGDESARRWMAGDLEGELAARGIQAFVHER